MKRKLNYFAFIFAIILGLSAFVGIAQNANTNAKLYAAEFTYSEGRDGFELTADNDLKVTYTVSYMEPGLTDGLIKWVVYLVDPATGLAYNATTHKYEDSNNRQRNVADYYFLIDPSNAYDKNGNKVTANQAGTYTIYVDSNDAAYHTTTEPQSASDFGTNTGKVLNDVLNEKNWIIGVGPMFRNWWASGYGAPIDYYVGRQSELAKATIYFKDFDGTDISSKKYYDTSMTVDVSGVNYTKDAQKTWTGWYCDSTKATYNELSDIQSLLVSDVMSSTKTINFYATYQRGNGKYIEFTPVANYEGNYTQDTENDTLLLEETNNSKTFSVTYKITHNDGVNSILLLPEFDTTKFSIVGVNIDETTSLDKATITYDGYDKILLESENFYNGLNDAFITVTFNIDKPVDGDYEFGLKLVPFVHNDVSEAYYYLSGNDLGEQEEVEIRVVKTNNVVRILTLKDAEILIGKNAHDDIISGDSYTFKYAKSAVSATKVESVEGETENLVVKYSYDGTAEPVIKWYAEAGEELPSAPILAGRYYVGISAPAHGLYHAVSEVYRLVVINPVTIQITVEDKTSVYLADIVELTYQITSGAVLEGDTISVELSTTATNTSSVGNYDITAQASSTGSYVFDIVNGTYIITKKAITITAIDQKAEYTGSEPEVDQTKYTVDGIDEISGVKITKADGVNVGEYTLTPSYVNENYEITFVNGKFYITSVGKDAEYIKSFFSGDRVVYDANSHDLLIVDDEIPTWISANYTASGNDQTDANTYTISIVVTLDAQTAANYTNGETSFNSTVEGIIEPKALTITADNNGHVYGNEPATLTPTTVNGEGSDVIDVTFTVKAGEETIILAADTNVDEYAIVPSATNANYTFEYVNGTYTVSKATAEITVEAQNIFYNRALAITDSAKVGTLTIDEYTVVIKNANNVVVDKNAVLDAGEYTVIVTVDGTTNYDGAEETATFTINKIALETPTVSYNKGIATWTAVANDAGAENVPAKELYNTEIIYKINNAVVDGLSYTATSKDGLTLTVSSNNQNYLPVEIGLVSVYEIAFNDGNHPANPILPTNMPELQYVFEGQTATLPSQNPTLDGYTFNAWDYDFATLINEDKVIVALWDVNSYTITFKYTDDAETLGTDMFEFSYDYNQNITYADLNLVPTMSSENPGIYYTYNGEWISNLVKYLVNENGKLANQGTEYIVLGDATFVAQYDTNYNSFKVIYHLRENGGNYAVHGEPTVVTYLDTITYESLSTNIHWFTANGWFANEEVTEAAPTIMPNHDINVYGEIIFDIGQGDVNGDGLVNSNDITLYRQWIVGGYTMQVVANGTEWQTSQNFNENVRYFLIRVADNNADTSDDIRDVSVTRMGIVGGYTWDIDTGVNVSGQEIIRNVSAKTLNEIDAAIRAGKKVTVANDITELDGVLNVETNKNIYIDLNGHTLNVDLFNVVSTLKTTITVKNGTIKTANGITISAPHGNVILENLTGYVGDSTVNLQAASSSLHIKQNVAFYGNVVNEIPEPAAVNVEKGTHVVIEENACMIVKKLVVTKNFEPSTENDAVITFDNNNIVENQIVVEGKVDYEGEIKTLDDLKSAAKIGGNYTLLSDLSDIGEIKFDAYITIDGNGHTISGNSSFKLNALGAKIKNLKFKNIHNAASKLTPVYATGLAGKLEIENCEFDTVDWDALQIVPVAGAEVVVKNNTFKHSGENSANTHRYVHIQSQLNVDFAATIQNNKFYNVDILSETAIEVYYPTNENKVVITNNYVDSPVAVCILKNSGANAWYLAKNFVEEDLVTPNPMIAAVIETYNVYLFSSLQEAVDFAKTATRTITLVDDVNGNGVIVKENQNIIFDFNNHTYVLDGTTVGSAGTETNGFQLLKGATVTFKNGTLKTTTAKILIQNYANTTLDNFIVSGENAGKLLYVTSNNFGSLTVQNGSKILAYNNQVAFDLWYGMSAVYDDGVTVTLKAGTEVRGIVEYGAASRAAAGWNEKAQLIVEDSAIWDKAITLSSNIAINKQIVVDKDLTLNLNGHKIYNTTDIWNDAEGVKAWSLISVQNGTLTINGQGSLEAKANDCYAVDVRNGANLVINGGNYVGNVSAIYAFVGTATINGGNFSVIQNNIDPATGNQRFTLNLYDANRTNGTAKIIVNGGSFEKFDPANNVAEGANTNFVADGHTVTSAEVDGKTVYTVA